MSSNPFFVDVSGGGGSNQAATTPEQKFAQAGSGSALSGLGQVVAGVRQQKQLSADKAKKEKRMLEFQTRFKSVRSPEELIQLQIDFPELSKAQSNVMTAREKMLGEDRKEIFANVWGWRDSPNPVQSITQSINRNPRYAEDDFVIEALGRAREAEESGDFTEFQRWIDMTQATFNPKGYEARAEMQKAEQEKEYKEREFDLKERELDQKLRELDQKKSEGREIKNSELNAVTDDLRAITKEASGIAQSYRDLETLQAGSSPTDQLAAVFKFMKSLDPTSVVREGEQQMAQTTGGLADSLVSLVNSATGEGKMTPEVFQNIVNTAKSLAAEATRSARSSGTNFLDVYGDRLDQRTRLALEKMLPEEIGKVYPVPSQAAIEKLRSDPNLKSAFIKRYGEDAYLGAVQ